MAGKTFPGIGDKEDDSSPHAAADAVDSGGTPAPASPYYSGPTVVDDAKVEEGLQKLRALDAPADSLPAEADTALDIVESGGHQMPSFLPGLKDGGRGTFIGHSVFTPLPVAPEPEKPFDDRMRGTLYGHMLHLPELVQAVPEEPSSRELTIVDRSAPTSHAVEVYQPAIQPLMQPMMARHAEAIPQEAEAYPVSNRNRSIPIDLEDGSRRRLIVRAVAATIAIAAIVGAALIWLRTNSDEPDAPVRPSITLQPPPAAPVLAPPRPSLIVQPMAPPVAPAPEVRTDDAPAHPDEDQAKPRPAPDRARSAATSRHHGATSDGSGKPKTTKSKTEDDPDGTLAPTIE